MSFYKEVRTFFLKNDPGRVRLAKKIAANFKTKSAQKVVMKRLVEVYRNGGPDNIKIIPSISETPKVAVSIEEE
ncbi:MAG: hypothetical protein N4A35_04715 [Flavobacteriales bacterium]|jgi:hypothetical protein|nr:hypothetical protein [Flavobacteriales bacterium]